VSDLDTIEIRTNFTNLSPKLYAVQKMSGRSSHAAADPGIGLPSLDRRQPRWMH
jgi:hypothetical protein